MVTSCMPANLEEALDYLARESVIPYGGGTDLMVEAKKGTGYLFLHKVPELKNIVDDGTHIRIGASCTFTDVALNPLTPAILREAVLQIAAPAIRNLGTIGGNVGNGSPKADSALIFFAAGAKLRLAGKSGDRVINIKDFYLGRKKLDLRGGELIAEVLLPREGLDNYYYKKIGARNALAISRVSFAGILDVRDGVINNCAAAFGAVSEVIIRREDIDAVFRDKTIAEAKALKEDYLKAYEDAIVPIRGRISAEYRKEVCMRLLRDFLETNGI